MFEHAVRMTFPVLKPEPNYDNSILNEQRLDNLFVFFSLGNEKTGCSRAVPQGTETAPQPHYVLGT